MIYLINNVLYHILYFLRQNFLSMKEPAFNQFDQEQLKSIKDRFQLYAINDKMNLNTFKRFMGLLGIGQSQFLCNRIFPLITAREQFDCTEFLEFLTKITYGDKVTKAKISFDFLDRRKKGYVTHEDIEEVISQISFIWNFLTGQKVSNSDSIQIICNLLAINQQKSMTFTQFLEVYDHQIDWYDYFNSRIKTSGTIKRTMNINQIQQYLKLLHHEIQTMIIDLKQTEETQAESNLNSFSDISEINFSKGPIHISTQQFKPRGDFDTRRESLAYQRASTLSRGIEVQGTSKMQIITKKLQQFQRISGQLFPQYKLNQGQKASLTSRNKKKTLVNITQPEKHRKNIVYFGHENWNIMLNMMLGIRNSLKSHFYKFEQNIEFTEQDLSCKYQDQLIYKQNNKSVQEICQLFIDYTPKVFAFIRSYFKIENKQFLKSIGLENLIGNFVMGNLSTLTDQTSEGKSGSFIYYTEDTKLIVKSISREEYKKLRLMLGPYVQYIRENPNTFLLHIYGLYKMKNKLSNRQIYFMVINNFFQTSLQINERYDLKGSTYNRKTVNKSLNTALKDVDLMNNHDRTFRIDTKIKQQIYNQILRDTEFLVQNNITQYSLLVGIHKNVTRNQQSFKSTGFASCNKDQIFFFGIIDILTEYSAKKVFENHVFHLFNSDTSCLSPQDYNERFKNFIYKYIFSS